jgi:hypothetical protein
MFRCCLNLRADLIEAACFNNVSSQRKKADCLVRNHAINHRNEGFSV